MTPTLRRLGWFIVVGCTAAAIHFGVVVVLVRYAAWAPLAANVVAWLVAFTFSFAGHWRLTFAASGARLVQAAKRFFLVSLAGFAVNETMYALMLSLTSLRYDVIIALVLVAVAVMTYLLSSRWAFRRSVST